MNIKNLKPFLLIECLIIYVLLVLDFGIARFIFLPLFLILAALICLKSGRLILLGLSVAFYIPFFFSFFQKAFLVLAIFPPLLSYLFFFPHFDLDKSLKKWFFVISGLMILFSIGYFLVDKFFITDCHELLVQNEGKGMTQEQKEACKNF